MQSKMPRTPFATKLSNSAKETELRLRSIFQWKKKRPPVIILIAAILIVVFCGTMIGFSSSESTRTLTFRRGTVEDFYEDFFAESWVTNVSFGSRAEREIRYSLKADQLKSAEEYVCSIEMSSALRQKKYTGTDIHELNMITLWRDDGKNLDVVFIDEETVVIQPDSGKDHAYKLSVPVDLDWFAQEFFDVLPFEGEEEDVDSSSPQFIRDEFFERYETEFPEYVYSGPIAKDGLWLEDIPENIPEEMVVDEFRATLGSVYFNVTFHSLCTMNAQDFVPGIYFKDEKRVESFLSALWADVQKNTLSKYTVVYADLSWTHTAESLALGPQLGNGRYERLYLFGKTDEASEWSMTEVYWGDYVLDRIYSNEMSSDENDSSAEEILSPDSEEYRDQMIRDYYAETYQRNVYLAGEEPDQPQESDLRIEEITVLGETRVYEVTGQLLEVRQSRYYESDGWWEYSSHLVITKGIDNAYDRVIGTAYIRKGQTVEEVILEKVYGLSDLEVSLWREGYPWPVGPGSEIHIYREAYDGPETVEVQEGWDPIYYEGDYWAIHRWNGVEALCYHRAADGGYGVNTFDTTRTDLRTYRGIRVGDNRESVKAAYPELKSGDYWGKYPGEDYLWYCASDMDWGPALIFFFENDIVCRIVLIDMFN